MFPPTKGLAAELEASTDVVFRGVFTAVEGPSGTRRVMFMSHATDVEASTTKCTVCELVTASLRLQWRVTIPRRLSNVSGYNESSGVFVTYFVVAHIGLFLVMSCCGGVAASEVAVSEDAVSEDAVSEVAASEAGVGDLEVAQDATAYSAFQNKYSCSTCQAKGESSYSSLLPTRQAQC